MAIANVQIKSGTADDTTSIAITPDSNVTSGNLLVIYAMKYAPSATDNFVVGDLAKTAGTSTIGTITMDIETDYAPGWGGFAAVYSVPVTGTGTITLTLSSISGSWFFVAVQEVSGADTSASRVAGTNSDGTDNTSPYDSGTVALTGGGIFAGCIATLSNGNITFTQDAAFTLAAEQENGVDHMTGAAAYRIVTGSTTDSATWTTTVNDPAAIVLAVYKEGAASALTISVSDSVTLSESKAASLPNPLTASKSEAITLTENATAALETGSFEVNVNDAVGAAESTGMLIISYIGVEDDITLIEPTFFGFESLEVNKSETVNTAESHAEAVGSSQVNKSDAVTVTENHAELVTSFVNVTDAIVTAESYSVATAALAVDVSEAVTVTESASVNLPIAGTHTVNVNESITLTENVAAEVGSPQVSVSDVVGAAESVGAEVGSPQVNVSGAVAVGEGVTLFVNEAGALGVNVSDGASLAEAVTLALNTLVIASQESIGLSEAASVLVMGSVIGGDAAVEFSRASATTGIAKATASVEVK